MDEKPVLTVNVVTPDGSVYENTTDLDRKSTRLNSSHAT